METGCRGHDEEAGVLEVNTSYMCVILYADVT